MSQKKTELLANQQQDVTRYQDSTSLGRDTLSDNNRQAQLVSLPVKNEHILLFELSVGGHYPEYISHLISYFCEHCGDDTAKYLTIVLSPEFKQRHQEVMALAASYSCDRLKIITISDAELAGLASFSNGLKRNLRAWQEFELIKQYAISLKASQIFLPYFDTRQIPILLGSKLPCACSGIYFRPSFHYVDFPGYVSTWKSKLQHLREKLTLTKVLKNPQVKTLFCLDSLAIAPINSLSKTSKAVYLPDPVKVVPQTNFDREHLKQKLGIESDRKIFLLFGDLSPRKGIKKLLAAIPLISQEQQQKLCFLLVGSMSPRVKQQFEPTVKQLAKTCSSQIILHDDYIPEADIPGYFELADFVLAIYQNHVGMSGILNRAAMAEKPVLATNYGLMGEVTRRYQLGLTVDARNPQEIAWGITELIKQKKEAICDLNLMQKFVQNNSPEEFAALIFNNI